MKFLIISKMDRIVLHGGQASTIEIRIKCLSSFINEIKDLKLPRINQGAKQYILKN